MAIIGEYAKIYGLMTNINQISKIVEPFVAQEDLLYVSALLWEQMSKVQHIDVSSTMVLDFNLTDAIGQYVEMKNQADLYAGGKKQFERFKQKVDSYK